MVLGKHYIWSVREILLEIELGDAGRSQRTQGLVTPDNIVGFCSFCTINFLRYKCEILLIFSSFLSEYNNQCTENESQELRLCACWKARNIAEV